MTAGPAKHPTPPHPNHTKQQPHVPRGGFFVFVAVFVKDGTEFGTDNVFNAPYKTGAGQIHTSSNSKRLGAKILSIDRHFDEDDDDVVVSCALAAAT
jgi:hypothetical protein